MPVAFYLFFWMLHVTMTRVYAQVGPPILELYFLDPQTTLTRMIGTLGHSPRSLTMFSLMYWINRTDRGHPMAHQLASFYVEQGSRFSRKWFQVLTTTIVIGTRTLDARSRDLLVLVLRAVRGRRRIADVLAIEK